MESNKKFESGSNKPFALRLTDVIESQAKSLDLIARNTARIADALEFLARSEAR